MRSIFIPKYKLILMFLTIYFSVNSFILAVKYSEWTNQIMIAVVILVGTVSLIKGNNPINSNAKLLIIIGLFNVFCTTIINGFSGGYILYVMNFILIISVHRLFTKEEFIESYLKIIYFLSIFAIVAGVISIVVPSALSFFRMYKSVYDYYADMIFAFQNTSVIRINSIWGEPGMFAVFLIFALYLDSFNNFHPINNRRFIVYSIALFLTFSTAGIICYLLYIIVLLLSRGKVEKKLIFAVAFIAVLILTLINSVDIISVYISSAQEKLSSDNISFIGRIAPVLYNLQEGFKNPLFGEGLTSGKFYINFSFYQGYLTCDTSTTSALFKNFGLYMSMLTVYLSYKLAKSTSITPITILLSSILLIMNVNTQNLIFDQIYWIILFIPYMTQTEELYGDENLYGGV